MTELLQFDQNLFHLINSAWQNPFLDAIMPYWRHKLFWFPLYMFLISYLLINFKLKGLYLVFALFLAVGVADIMSSHLIKKSVKRARPCNNLEIREEVHLLVRCGSGYSFTSSHATNHFAIAAFFIFTLFRKRIGLKWLAVFWAGSISYGQVYVGVHYPLDILAGSILGLGIGWGVAKIYKQLEQIRIEAFYDKEDSSIVHQNSSYEKK